MQFFFCSGSLPDKNIEEHIFGPEISVIYRTRDFVGGGGGYSALIIIVVEGRLGWVCSMRWPVLTAQNFS